MRFQAKVTKQFMCPDCEVGTLLSGPEGVGTHNFVCENCGSLISTDVYLAWPSRGFSDFRYRMEWTRAYRVDEAHGESDGYVPVEAKGYW